MNVMGIALLVAGVFSILGGVLNWDWFMNHRKAQFVCSICGRGGARIFYVVLGAALVTFGVLLATGVIRDTD